MTELEQDNPVQRARRLTERGAWQEAFELLCAEAERGPLDGPDLAFFADVAYAVGRLDLTIATWERAHADALSRGDRLTAAGAAVRVALHLLLDTGLMAPVRGWVGRAERLLDADGRTAIHAWLAVVRSYERMLSGDFEAAWECAMSAVELGTESDPSAAALGRVARARSLIFAGDVPVGLELLEEAAISAVSGELDPLPSGIVYCEVVCALQAVAHYDLAEEWTIAMESWRQDRPVGSIHGRCRVHRAEILRLRGSLEDAENEALIACEELKPYAGRELGWPLSELGRIRLQAGDLDGAESAFRAAHQIGWDPFPGLALVYLERGEGAMAVQSIRDALERPLDIPSKEAPPNTELRRAPLLAAQVEIEIAAGDRKVAGAAAEELSRIAATFRSEALAAAADMALARVSLAEGVAVEAKKGFERAVRRWSAIGAPYETAQARVGLARSYRLLGSERQASLELEVARTAFDQMRAGAGGGHQTRSDQDAVFRRESDHWLVRFDGKTIRVRDLKGLRYIARLLARPRSDTHVCDLVVDPHGGRLPFGEHRTSTDVGLLLDDEAKRVYRRRLEEIDEDIEEARAFGDHARMERAQLERDFLSRELARALGLGGRDRRTGAPAERARVSVTRAIRRAIDRVREHHPVLGDHLAACIRTGTYCAYTPDPRVPTRWRL